MSNQPDTVTDLTGETQAIVDNARAWDAIDPAFGPDACERVLARVEALTGPAGAPPSARVPRRVVLFTLLAAAALGGGVGAKSMLGSTTKTVASDGVSASSAATAPPLATTEASAELPSIDVAALPTAPRETTPARASSAPAEGTTLAEELRLTTAARKALAAGDPSSALRALDEHERRFPNGQLAQERDSVRIQALVADGQVAAARGRAAEFRDRYPGGLLLPSVERALGPHE